MRASGIVDPGWDHGVAQDERKKKVKCNYCGKIVSGGIYRLKQHLARLSGEVTHCDKAPQDVYLSMKANMEGCRSSRRPRQTEDVGPQTYLNFHPKNDEEEVHVGYRSKGKQLMGERNVVVSLAPLRSLGYVDPGWDHGVAQDEKKKKVKCNYCEKIVSGGINRFKQHLARIPGEVAPCKLAPDEIYLRMRENMKWHRTGRRQRQPYGNDFSPPVNMQSDNEDQEDDQVEPDLHHLSTERLMDGDRRLSQKYRKIFNGPSCTGSEPLYKRSRLDSLFLNAPNNLSPQNRQEKVRTISNRISWKEVISGICKFFYHSGVPLQAANSLYFHKMLGLVGQYGPGVAAPTSQLISGRCLEEEIATIKDYFAEYKASWAVTGCSVMADSWQDTEGRTLINFLASGPSGVHFVSSVDATEIIQDSSELFELLDKVVEEMGEENVVQVITPNTTSFKAAGKILEEKRKNLFWTPCVTNCIDQILKHLADMPSVAECIRNCQKITKLIYSQIWLLNLMKNGFTHGKELLRPSITQFASSFATLQSLVDHRIGLRKMFRSNKWISSQCSRTPEGRDVSSIVSDVGFWKNIQVVKNSVEPMMQILQKVESGDCMSVSAIYNDMLTESLAIKSIYGENELNFKLIRDAIQNQWDSLNHPIFVAAYFLNPSYRYRPDFLAHNIRGLTECIARLEPDTARRISACAQIADYSSAKADFGTELAISTRTELDPAAWWQQHGICCLELQWIAVRILSQTCSSIGCEHNWSIYDQMYSLRSSHLSQNRSNDLMYVHYNLRLRELQVRRGNSSVSLDNIRLEHLLKDWIVDTGRPDFPETEEVLYSEMEQVDVYANDMIDYEGGTPIADIRTGSSAELLNFVHPVDACTATDDECENDADNDELNFYDNDTSY